MKEKIELTKDNYDQDDLHNIALNEIRRAVALYLNMTDDFQESDDEVLKEFMILMSGVLASSLDPVFLDLEDAEIAADKINVAAKDVVKKMKDQKGSNVIEGAARKEIVMDTNIEAAKNESSRNSR